MFRAGVVLNVAHIDRQEGKLATGVGRSFRDPGLPFLIQLFLGSIGFLQVFPLAFFYHDPALLQEGMAVFKGLLAVLYRLMMRTSHLLFAVIYYWFDSLIN